MCHASHSPLPLMMYQTLSPFCSSAQCLIEGFSTPIIMLLWTMLPSTSAVYARHEREKRRTYEERTREVAMSRGPPLSCHSSCRPVVVSGGESRKIIVQAPGCSPLRKEKLAVLIICLHGMDRHLALLCSGTSKVQHYVFGCCQVLQVRLPPGRSIISCGCRCGGTPSACGFMPPTSLQVIIVNGAWTEFDSFIFLLPVITKKPSWCKFTPGIRES